MIRAGIFLPLVLKIKPTLIYSHGPINVPPAMACLIGLNEAIIFQRVIWLCEESNFGRLIGDRRWIFNTPEGWRYWFPFFSAHTIRRTLDNLREMNLLSCEAHGGQNAPFFYSPSESCETVLRRLEESSGLAELQSGLSNLDTRLVQNGHAACIGVQVLPNQREESASAETPNQAKPSKKKAALETAKSLLEYLNQKTGTSYRLVDTNLNLIAARLAEDGVDASGCKTMIDRQTHLWKGTDMEQFLRPATLFGKQKFDAYYANRDKSSPSQNGPRQPAQPTKPVRDPARWRDFLALIPWPYSPFVTAQEYLRADFKRWEAAGAPVSAEAFAAWKGKK